MAETASSHIMRHTDPPNYRGEAPQAKLEGSWSARGKGCSGYSKGKGKGPQEWRHCLICLLRMESLVPTSHSALTSNFAD